MKKHPCFRIHMDDGNPGYIVTMDELTGKNSLYHEVEAMGEGNSITITRVKDMTQEELDSLPEFQGF